MPARVGTGHINIVLDTPPKLRNATPPARRNPACVPASVLVVYCVSRTTPSKLEWRQQCSLRQSISDQLYLNFIPLPLWCL